MASQIKVKLCIGTTVQCTPVSVDRKASFAPLSVDGWSKNRFICASVTETSLHDFRRCPI